MKTIKEITDCNLKRISDLSPKRRKLMYDLLSEMEV